MPVSSSSAGGSGEPPEPTTEHFTVPAQFAGKKVEKVLRALLKSAHPEHAEKLLRQKRVRMGGQLAKRGDVVAAQAELEIAPRLAAKPPPMPNRRLRLTVLHEDAAVLVIAKPAGLAMQPGVGHGTDTLVNALIGRYGDAQVKLGRERGFGLVHRLDRDASGPVVVARTGAAHEHLVQQFAEHRVEKRYVALVRGQPHAARGVARSRVAGRPAESRWATRERLLEHALLEVEPSTGRTHQIRIHLAALGCPVVGDARYAPGLPAARAAEPSMDRLFLHCERLAFVHPTSGARLVFEMPWPDELLRALEQLRAPRARRT